MGCGNYDQALANKEQLMTVNVLLTTPEEQIGEMAKICYDTRSLEDGGKDITSTLVHGHSHLAALRFAYMTVKIDGISIAAQNQLVRSSHLDFMVQSKRYVNADKGEFTFIMPEGLDAGHQKSMELHWNSTIALYGGMIREGVKKEDARAILPSNTSTKMNVTGNLQGWWDAFKLRLNPHAQSEIRSIFIEIFQQAKKHYPNVFTDEVFNKFTHKEK